MINAWNHLNLRVRQLSRDTLGDPGEQRPHLFTVRAHDEENRLSNTCGLVHPEPPFSNGHDLVAEEESCVVHRPSVTIGSEAGGLVADQDAPALRPIDGAEYARAIKCSSIFLRRIVA
jgi:hypothetical protein